MPHDTNTATKRQAITPPNAITAAIVRDDGGEAPAFCLMAAYRSEKDAMDAFAMIAAAPAQPAAEPSRFGSPELQAMIIARCVEKDQADRVQEDAARESEYRRGYRHGYEQRDAEVRGAMA